MGTTLTGKNISASYLGLLKTTDNAVIGASAKTITDGNGNDLPIKLSTAQFLVSDGSSSAPTIGFSSDTDTGLYRTGSGVLGITSNGTLSGEVTLTGYRVRKNSTASAPVYSFIGETTTGLHSLDTGRLDFILSGNRAFGMTYGSGVGTLQTLSTDKMAFSVGGSERLRIINDGTIGIGTATVTSGYDIDVLSSGADARILLRPSSNDEASYQLGNSSGDILTHFATSNGSSIINHAVGTGTTTNTRKIGLITCPSYDNTDGNMAMITGDTTDSTNNYLYLGSAYTGYSSPTDIIFRTTSTVGSIGSERMRITSGGDIALQPSTNIRI
jgi:hypothetical protein